MTLSETMPYERSRSGLGLLNGAAGLWLLVALAGQWAFAFYIANFYGTALASGRYEALGVFKKLGGTGYIPGDTAGNRAFILHALAAGIIALGGALQLMPWVRERWPRFHHWNGRVFLVTVTGLSLSGFWLVWVRHTSPSVFNAWSTTLNGVLILSFAALALGNALGRRFDIHQRWAIRLYLVSNAQWFLRIGVFGWFMANMAVGRKPHMSDPFFLIWTPGCYLIPLAVAELYLRARDHGGAGARVLTASLLIALTLIMAAGALAFTLFSLRLMSGQPLSLS